jgi:transcription elongation factor GreA
MDRTPTTPAARQPVVLTSAGHRWLHDRLARAEQRLARIEADLAAERTEELLADHHQVRDQVDELRAVLDRAITPDQIDDDPTIVELGDEVDVRFEDGEVETFLFVHPLEATMDEHRTSSDSPLAQAVLGHRVGDQVTVRSPSGAYQVTIEARRRLG